MKMSALSGLLIGTLMSLWACHMAVAETRQFDLSTATIADIQEAIDSGKLTSQKLVQLYLARIEAYDKRGPKLNAVITLNSRALEEARALDEERLRTGRRSELHGIPIVVKDLVDVAGMPTTAGFIPFGAPVPTRDAEIIARIKAAGGIILAKVSTSNWFGNGFDDTHPIGMSLNPYNVKYSAGGSSNGTGVALAANFATVGIGTDTGGSVQVPAAYNSVTGMVATPGLVSRAGIVPRGATQDRAGPMGRNIYDLTVLLAVMSGWDAEDYVTQSGIGRFPQADWATKVAAADLKGRRIGVLREMLHQGPEHDQGLALFEHSLADMRAAGAFIIDPVLTGLDLKTLATSAVGRTAEYEKLFIQNAYLARLGSATRFATIQQMMQQVGHEKFSRLMVEALTLPAPERSPEYAARLENRHMLNKLINDTMQRLSLDALVLPFRTLPPPAIDSMAGGGGGNSLSSNNGLASIIVPGGYIGDNLPIGIQFIGKNFDDLTLLQVAAGYERASQKRKMPSITPALSGERFDY